MLPVKLDFSHISDNCKVLQNLELAPAEKSVYDLLAPFHYRQNKLGPYTKIFAIYDRKLTAYSSNAVAAVIVYAMPVLGCQLRTVATKARFLTGDRQRNAQLLNENIRCISRIIVEPRYRGLGLAEALVAGTLNYADTPFVETMSVMSKFTGFFQRAGMTKFDAPICAAAKRMKDVLTFVGIDEQLFIEPKKAYNRLCNLDSDSRRLVENQSERFIQNYGRSGKTRQGLARLEFILERLSARPAYYIWQKH